MDIAPSFPVFDNLEAWQTTIGPLLAQFSSSDCEANDQLFILMEAGLRQFPSQKDAIFHFLQGEAHAYRVNYATLLEGYILWQQAQNQKREVSSAVLPVSDVVHGAAVRAVDGGIESMNSLRLTVAPPDNPVTAGYVGLNAVQRRVLGLQVGDVVELFDGETSLGVFMVG